MDQTGSPGDLEDLATFRAFASHDYQLGKCKGRGYTLLFVPLGPSAIGVVPKSVQKDHPLSDRGSTPSMDERS